MKYIEDLDFFLLLLLDSGAVKPCGSNLVF
jgi:hypothetical protein